MRRVPFLLATLILVCTCAAPPAPTSAPETPAPPPAAPVEDKVIGEVRVTASALNVRKEPSTDADVVRQVKKGDKLALLAENDDWVKVRAGDQTGWVAARFVSRGGAEKKKGKKGCESDFAFIETPTLVFSDSSAHGIVVVEASVNVKGNVTGTKVVSNSTGDEALGFLAEKEIKAAKFSPPIRNCVPRAFIFTYRRTY